MPDTPAAVTPPGFTTLPDIIATLTAARVAQGFSQRETADFIGVTQSTLALWETPHLDRRRVPTVPLLLALANALGYDLRLVSLTSAVNEYARGWNDCARAVIAATRPDTTDQTGAPVEH